MINKDIIRIKHMRDSVQEILSLTANMTQKTFDSNRTTQLSVLYLIGVIGEAANMVSNEFRARYPEIPRKKIIGMRHRLIHDYYDINFDIVWQTVLRDIPNLAPLLGKIIELEEELQ